MTVKGNATKRYDREFKLGAVKLVLEEGKRFADVAEAIGASEPSVRQWVAAYRRERGEAFPGSGRLAPQDEEIRRLKEELRVTRMERDILKKTIAFFAERPK
jgi:transposase